MKHIHILLGALFVILIAVLAYIFFVAPASAPVVDDTAPVQNEDELAPPYVQQDSLTHTFEDGVHTIAGVMVLPTPCHQIVADTMIAESFPEQVSIVISVPEDEGVCIQVLEDRSFSVDVEVSRDATFSITTENRTLSVPALPAEAEEEA